MPATKEQCRRYRQRLKERATAIVAGLWKGRCQKCGELNDVLEFAHVQPTGLSGMGRGLTERYLDVLKNPECYALMCKPCHKEYDNASKDTDQGDVAALRDDW